MIGRGDEMGSGTEGMPELEIEPRVRSESISCHFEVLSNRPALQIARSSREKIRFQCPFHSNLSLIFEKIARASIVGRLACQEKELMALACRSSSHHWIDEALSAQKNAQSFYGSLFSQVGAASMVGKPDWGREGAPPSGQVRVLVLGDAGVGKTSLVHLIVNETRIKHPQKTVGCAVEVKHLVYREPTKSSYTQKYRDRDFFVELWDLSGHEQYKHCRSIFYSQINGVIFVHDLSQRKTKANLQGWASEVASQGRFSAPLPNGYTGSLPVPSLVIGNKSDIAPMGSSSNLVDAARQWVEKQGLLSPSDELPTTDKFPGSRDLHAAAKDGDLDLDAVRRFFVSLIQRKYYPEEFMSTTSQRSWDGLQSTTSTGAIPLHTRGLSFDDQLLSSSSSVGGDSAYNMPWSRQERLSPPTSPSPEKPLSQADFRAFKLGPVQSLTRSNSGTSRIDIHV